MLNELPEGFQIHIIWAVAKRAKEQDMVLCRLALFLDPRFRQAALAGSTEGLADFTRKATEWGYAQVCYLCAGAYAELIRNWPCPTAAQHRIEPRMAFRQASISPIERTTDAAAMLLIVA